MGLAAGGVPGVSMVGGCPCASRIWGGPGSVTTEWVRGVTICCGPCPSKAPHPWLSDRLKSGTAPVLVRLIMVIEVRLLLASLYCRGGTTVGADAWGAPSPLTSVWGCMMPGSKGHSKSCCWKRCER
jgi:hypothetical protein